MTQLLQRAFDEVRKLPDDQQDRIAGWILDELEAGEAWDNALAASQDVLSRLADEALKEHRAGKTHRLDPDKL